MTRIDDLQLLNTKRGYLSFEEESEFLTRIRTMAIENNVFVITAKQYELSPLQIHEKAIEAWLIGLLSDEDY